MTNVPLHRKNHARCRGIAWAVFLAPVVAFLLLVPAIAQQFPNISPDQVQQLQQQLGGNGNGTGGQVTTQANAPLNQQPMILQPAVPPQFPEGLQTSRLEQIMSARAGVSLAQYGYEQLGRAAAVLVPQTGAVQDDYLLGPGDEIVVVLRGQENNEYRASVDRNGQVILPRLGPISASGRTFGSFRQDIEAAVRRAYVATDASISVARLRQISVLVTGAVNNPGQRLVTGLSSALDAILISGGISKTGSLRDVRVIRGGRQYSMDLYSVISGGTAGNMRLADGDRIFVPPLGRTVAVAGLVRRAGIYELPPTQSSISAQALIALAGGREVSGNYLYSIVKLQSDGRTALVQLKNPLETLGDGEVLILQFEADQTVARASLSGGTPLAGNYPLNGATRLSEIIKLPGALGTSPYTLMGIIARRDPRTLLRTLIPFTPVAVLNGGEDIPLQADDIVRVISVDEMHTMVTAVHEFDQARQSRQEALRNPAAAAGSVGGGGQSSVAELVNRSAAVQAGGVADAAVEENTIRAIANRGSNRTSISGQAGAVAPTAPGRAIPPPNFVNQAEAPGLYAQNREVTTFAQLAQQLNVDPQILSNFLLDRTISIEGAIRGAGDYFVGASVTLQDLIMAAGGTMNWVDNSNIELISTFVDSSTGHSLSQVTKMNAGLQATYVIKPHDAFRFNQIFTDIDVGSATLQGEVRFAGNYKLTRGEHLSDLLARAGGLTNSAYPYGTVFLRRSAAVLEQEGYTRAAKEAEDALMTGLTRVGSDKIDPNTFSALQSFIVDLRNQRALGRVSINADPSLLASNPALDPLLEPGDVVYIPPRPSVVSVLGQVMQPGHFPYVAGSSAADYIGRAGGYSTLADSGNVYIVFPDGTARRLEKSWLRFTPGTALPPGTTIVVPRDVLPLDLRQTVIDITQILSQLAVSIASVAVISR